MGLSDRMTDEKLAERIMPFTEDICVFLRRLHDKLEILERIETFVPRKEFMRETENIDVRLESEAVEPAPDLRRVVGLVSKVAEELQKTGNGMRLDKFEPRDVIKFPTDELMIERGMDMARYVLKEEERARGDARNDTEKLKGAIRSFAVALKKNGVDLSDDPLNNFVQIRGKFSR